MNNLPRLNTVRQRSYFDLPYKALLKNPLWYVIGVVCLAATTTYLRLWWGLTAIVALTWGVWLLWQIFAGKAPNSVAEEAQLQGWLTQALDYRSKIRQALLHAGHNPNHLDARLLMSQLDTWIEVIQALSQRLAQLRCDAFLIQELATVPEAIMSLETQLRQTSNAALRAQLEQALSYRRTQLAGLEHLQGTVRQAEIQIESILSLLSILYAQILTGSSLSHVAASRHFLGDIDEEVKRLQDQLDALCEVRAWC